MNQMAVNVTLAEPVVAAQGPADLDRAGAGWGRWQFPSIRRLADGRLLVYFSLGADAEAEYGKPVGVAYSSDNGKTWRVGKPRPAHEIEDGVLLPNGDRLKPVQLETRRGEEFNLPTPAASFACSYGYPRSLYRVEDLPEELRQWKFRRLPAGASRWVEETADMHIPDEFRAVTQEGAGATPGATGIAPVKKGTLSYPSFHGEMRVAPDKSLWAVMYCMCRLRGKGERPLYLPVFLRSTDQGRSWDMLGEVPYKGDEQADPHAKQRDGFTEPAFNFMPDGSVICLMRTMDGFGHGPMYLSRSTDQCRTWFQPKVFDTFGKYPQLLTLGNGVSLATYGASGGPGYFVVRATRDPAGLEWEPAVQFKVSPSQGDAWDTCGHTGIVALNDDNALMVYSEFNFPDATGVPRKTILVRNLSTSEKQK